MLECSALSVWRERAALRAPPVLRELGFRVGEQERVALVGANGEGKTTLLLALVGAAPFEGRVTVDGVALDRSSLAWVRRRVSYVFADPRDQLFSAHVREEVEFGPRLRGLRGAELAARVARALGAVGLSGYEERSGQLLSLGEQRRLAVATALAIEPRVVLFDEPTASLDPRARRQVLSAIASTQAAVLFATHDLEAALELEARVIVVAGGKVLADGPSREVLAEDRLLEEAGLEVPLSIRLRRP